MIKKLMHDPIFLAGKSEVATKEDMQVAQDLLDTLMAHKETCVGMAANMIGVRKRIIAFLDESGRAPTYTVMLNPEIIKKDGAYDTECSIKTLSSGESFKASLSLALGLSDEIQSSAGGIRLDTMFVDEGFGSLDEESLNQAIRALLTPTEGNRLVGIISHVAELKERIERQIVVTKEKSGGSAVRIV